MERVEESAQILRAAEDILARIEDILDAEVAGGRRHELHETACADR